MKGGVTRHMLPHLSGVTHLHANRPLESKFLKCDLSLRGVVWSTYLSLDFIGEGWSWPACTLQVFPLQHTVDVCAQACWVKSSQKKKLCSIGSLQLAKMLQCDRENRERLTYLRNVYCVMTSHSKGQDTRTGHKTTN